MERLMRSRNILSLSREEKRKFLDSFQHVFSDIDGVVWNLYAEIPNSSKGFEALRKAGKRLTFITNNSVRSEADYFNKMKQHSINMESVDIIHPAKVIAKHLKQQNFKGLIYVIAAENFKNVLRNEGGLEIRDGPNMIISENQGQLMQYVKDDTPIRAVIIDFDYNFNILKMLKASYYLRQKDCLLIVGCCDSFIPTLNDFAIFGPGFIAKTLQSSSKRDLQIWSKPGKPLSDFLLQHYKITEPEKVLMIGDTLEYDIAFGKTCGFQTLLVLSGVCSQEDLISENDPQLLPDYYAYSIADFEQFMQDL